ncbi:MAG: type I 3-dehydroquinate dehydratase [Treponema sp.]|nr:type I 3-dehydroquinate dehydratase [Treponema sp.]
MAKLCLCLTAKTLERNLEILNKYRKYADMAELRVDCLDPNERFQIRRFPEQTDMPVILTIRRDVDGGFFNGGEGSRINLMAQGLAYADADRRRNFAYLDIEEDLNVPSLEEAARAFGTRIIRSCHNLKNSCGDLLGKMRTMRHSEDEIIKLAVMANTTRDVLDLFRAGKECQGQEKILIAMGNIGVYSRILAEQFGSFLSYSSAYSEPDIPHVAQGQLDIQELAKLYRFRRITANTKVYGVTGFSPNVTRNLHFFNMIFGLEDIDAVYAPFPMDSIETFMEMAQELGVKGLSVTVPYKEAVIPFLEGQSPEAQNIKACNTLSCSPYGWMGANTEARGFSDSLLAFLDRSNLKRMMVTVIGAGGAARAVAAELHRLGAKALILNRTVHKARNIASAYKFAWGGLDNRGIDMMDKYSDIIIQTTTAGMEGNDSGDPVAMYSFCGRESVMDLIYRPEKTDFLKRAADAGCRVQNGYDMFIRQAQYQYALFTGKEFPEYLMARLQMDSE